MITKNREVIPQQVASNRARVTIRLANREQSAFISQQSFYLSIWVRGIQMSQRVSNSPSGQNRETVEDFTAKIAELVHANFGFLDSNPVIRFRGLPSSGDGSAIFERNVTYNSEEDIFLAGVVSLPSDDGRFMNERLMLKSPYKTKESINSTSELDAVPRFDGGRWHIEANTTEACVRHFLNSGHDVVGHLQLFIELIEIPDREPSLETQSTRESALDESTHTHSGGGETPVVATGTCPARGCQFESGEFKILRSHIGGKVAAGDREHERLSIQLNDFQ